MEINLMEDTMQDILIEGQFSIDAKIAPSASGEPEIQKITSPFIVLGESYIPLSVFRDHNGDSIADILMERYSQAMEKIVAEEIKRIDVELQKERAWERTANERLNGQTRHYGKMPLY